MAMGGTGEAIDKQMDAVVGHIVAIHRLLGHPGFEKVMESDIRALIRVK